MDRPKLLLPAALAVSVLGAGCGKKATPPTAPAVSDAAAVAPPPDAAPPDAVTATVPDRPDYPVG